MTTKLTTKLNPNKVLPPINSNEFNNLYYKDKLYIINLYYYNKSKYLDLCRLPPKELEYIDRSIGTLFRVSHVPEVAEDLPLSFVTGCFCAYLSNYNEKWWDEDFSPVDDLGLSHKRIFGIHLFDFPLVSFDRQSAILLRWLIKYPEKTRANNDIFYYLLKLRAAWEYLGDNDLHEVDIWNLSIVHLNKFVSISDLNGAFPVIEDAPLLELIEDDVLVPLFSHTRGYKGRRFMPLVPAELYLKTQFKLKGWDFLVQQ